MTQRGREVLELTGEPADPRRLDELLARWLNDTVPHEGAVHILLADDDEKSRATLGDMLADAGMTVTEAKDGQQVLTRAATRAPDVVVLDWPIPCGGLPLAQRLIADYGMTGRVIMLADAYDRRDHQAALKTGAHYLVKPATAERLIATVRLAAGQRGSG
jgi:DNA-binding response OmpR family regulator